MTDHIFEPETVAALTRQPIEEDETILAVDRKLECIFDMDDATKVRCIGNYIIDIGKADQILRCHRHRHVLVPARPV